MQTLVKIFVLCLLVIVPAVSWGQADTFYYNTYHQLSKKDSAKYYRIYHLESNHKYSGQDRYIENNKLYMAGNYSLLDSNGIRDGHFVEYGDSGFIKREGDFLNDHETGLWKNYYNNSNLLWYTENYENGKLNGELKSYYRSGKLKRLEIHKASYTAESGVCYDTSGKEIPFTQFRTVAKPSYDFNKYLSKHLKYPKEALEHNIQGRVIARFLVDEEGNISDIRIIKHVSPEIDAEAYRVLSQMRPWEPAILDDLVIKLYFMQPLTFSLQ